MSASVPTTVGGGTSFPIASPESFNGMVMENANMVETTSDFTRQKSPSTCYWKAKPTFKKGGKTAQTLRLVNVKVPFFKDKAGNYGSLEGYMNGGVDAYLREGIEKMVRGKAVRVVTEESSLVSTTKCWWKTFNNLNGTVGTLDSQSEFDAKVPRQIMIAKQGGIIINGEFSVQLQASRVCEEGNDTPLSTEDVVTVKVDVVRAYINAIGVDIDVPARKSTTQGFEATKPVKAEITPDDVISQLAQLGL
ncbi:hypothetical protein ColKHC_14264 [Colletotrichum higginsianum]|nr:hypothetical protein ColKHC_14264 [Colletotrichum higginsianum]